MMGEKASADPPETPDQNAKVGGKGKSFDSYEELYECVCRLLGQPDEFPALKRIFHNAVLFSSKKVNYSTLETLQLKFLLGCFYLLLKKYNKAAQTWNEVYESEKETPGEGNKPHTVFINGFQKLTTASKAYHWAKSSKNQLHLFTVIKLIEEFSFSNDVLMTNLKSMRKIAKKIYKESPDEYKNMKITELPDSKGTDSEREFISVIHNKIGKLKKTEVKIASVDAECKEDGAIEAASTLLSSQEENAYPRFKDIAKEIHNLLGIHEENRESYRKLRKIFNDTICNVKISKNFTTEEVDSLYFLRGCYYFVSTWNKLKAIRSWIHLYNRNKNIIQIGFKTFPEKYKWSDYARANLYVSTIIKVLDYCIRHHMLNSEDERVCEDMIRLAKISLNESGGILEKMSVSRRKIFLNTPEAICHTELINSIFDLLGDPDCYDVLAELFPSKNFVTGFNKEEFSYVEFLMGCFYFIKTKYKAINLWMRYVSRSEKIFEQGFKALTTAPKDYQWHPLVEESLHLSVILKFLKNFDASYNSKETAFQSLNTLVQLVNVTLARSSVEYRMKDYNSHRLNYEVLKFHECNRGLPGHRNFQNREWSINDPNFFATEQLLLEQEDAKSAEKEMENLLIPRRMQKMCRRNDTENVYNETEAIEASLTASSSHKQNPCSRFKDIANEIQNLLGQHQENRENYRKLRKIFNDTICNVEVLKNYTTKEVDNLYFLQGCYYFVSTWNKLKAIRSWIHLYNRNKKIIQFGFKTLPETYEWSDYARVNLYLSTIISVLDYCIRLHMLDSEDERVCADILSLAKISFSKSGGIPERIIFSRRKILTNTPESLCHAELVNSIFDLLGDPECFNDLAHLFPWRNNNITVTDFNKEEWAYVEFMRGCFYFINNKFKAINLWISYVNRNEKIFEEGFKALTTAPKDYQWHPLVQESLHLSVILKFLKNFDASYLPKETAFQSLKSLNTLVQLVDDTLGKSVKKYRNKNYSQSLNDEISKFQECTRALPGQEQRSRKLSTNYADLFAKLGKLLGQADATRAEKDMEKLVIPALRNASDLNRVHLKFWKGCFLFRTNSQRTTLNEWIEIFQKYEKNCPIDDDLRLLTIWPNQYNWSKSAKKCLKLPEILRQVEQFSKYSSTRNEKALASLEESLKEAIAKYLPTDAKNSSV